MKRIVLPLLLVAILASAVYASCKVGELGWAYSVNQDKPNTFNVRVKGSVQNTGKTATTVVVKLDIYKKADNTKVTTMSATVENIAPGAKGSFTAGPAMVVQSGTDVNATYFYKLQSATER